MLKKSIFLLLALVLAACSAGQKLPATPTADVNVEEQAVYSAALKALYGKAPSFVIIDTTATDPGGVGNTDQTLEHVKQNMHDIDQTTLDSFKSRNAEAHPVPADMQLGVPYVVITQEQRSSFFGQNQDGWQGFYKNYPDVPGMTNISSVGFNSTYTQAMVYVGTMSYYLAGAGYYLLLHKVDGAWTVDQQVMTWIS